MIHAPPFYPLTRSQFYARVDHGAATPCRRLMLAVMIEAVAAWQGAARGVGRDRPGVRVRLAREANDWIFGPLNHTDLFSFATICDVLSIDVGALRGGLVTARRAGVVFDFQGLDGSYHQDSEDGLDNAR